MTQNDKIIKFLKGKDFKLIKLLGQGGTGDTLLLLDETTDIEFAFKKFAPKEIEYRDEYYKRFVDEIKILFKLYHPNIVRIFNYYLYPENVTGYIQMEYIQGSNIQEFRETSSGKEWNEIFVSIIQAFSYLEQNKILHRDIRPQNILIAAGGVPKIIDFGFGLDLPQDSNGGTSVLLNWPVSEHPAEIIDSNPKYTHQTEIYYLGKLFKSLKLDQCTDFRFNYIISKMCKHDPAERYLSFGSIVESITKKDFKLIEFSQEEKTVYKSFADLLGSIIANHIDTFEPITDAKIVLLKLEKIVKIIDLEETVQYIHPVLASFLNNNFAWYSRKEFKTKLLIDFYKMMIDLDEEKQQAVIDNLIVRLRKIDVEFDELPY